MRVFRVVVCCLLLLGAGSACGALSLSVRYVTTTGVFLDQGEPAALFLPCPGDGVWEVTVQEREEPAGESWPEWEVRAPRANSAAAGDLETITQVRLLQTPPGWEVTSDSIARLQPERLYWVSGEFVPAPNGPTLVDIGVHFRLDQLEGLADGEVWTERYAAGQGIGKQQVMSRDDFVTFAEESCQAPH